LPLHFFSNTQMLLIFL